MKFKLRNFIVLLVGVVFLLPNTAFAATHNLSTNNSASNAFGNDTNNNFSRSQSFTITGSEDQYYLDSITLYVQKIASPTVDTELRLYLAGASDKPTGSIIATSEPINGTELTTSFALTVYTFEDPPLLDSGTQYAFRIIRSDNSSDGTNYFSLQRSDSNNYGGGNMLTCPLSDFPSACWDASAGAVDMYGSITYTDYEPPVEPGQFPLTYDEYYELENEKFRFISFLFALLILLLSFMFYFKL